MKKYLLISLVVLAGCTQGGSGGGSAAVDNSPNQIGETTVEVSRQSYTDLDVIASLDPVIFATDAVHQESEGKFTIKNTSAAALPLSMMIAPDDNFKIKVNRCPAQLDIGKSCSLVVSFSSRALIDGDVTASLLINGGVDVALTGRVLGHPDPASAGLPHLRINWIGSISQDHRAQSLTIKNDGSGNATDVVLDVPAGYGKRINHCPAILLKNQSCLVQLMFKDREAVPTSAQFMVSAKAASNPNYPVSYLMDPVDSRFVMEDLSFSDDQKSIVIIGQNLGAVVGGKAYDENHVLLGSLSVLESNGPILKLKPSSSNVYLPNSKFTIELN